MHPVVLPVQPIHRGRPVAQSRPSGWPAITAIVLADGGAVVATYWAVMAVLSFRDDLEAGRLLRYSFAWSVALTGTASLLAVGATLMVRRKAIGRPLVVLGSCAAVVVAAVTIVVALRALGEIDVSQDPGSDLPNPAGMVAAGAVVVVVLAVGAVILPALLTALLTLLPSTKRWLTRPKI
ncbi:MAG: hypothetical protein QM728_02535 [Gordonia sp. (in: high G+C Gram-positive bacteria)]|uniref:hypothetical protein n=1 Tax=Gordonia sp. (in: high G+C Gram-positive bacteria) TaxID=84139 RepID=UPI0039E51838